MATTGGRGACSDASRNASAIASAAGCINVQWKGADTGNSSARLAPFDFGERHGALDRGCGSGDHDLSAAVVVGGLANRSGQIKLACRLERDCGDFGEIEPEDRGHRALADRNRLLHGLSADAQQPRGVFDGQRTRGAEGGIFAQRMARDEGGVAGDDEAGLALERPQSRQARRHQRRLGVGGQRQLRLRPLEHELRELLAERCVYARKHVPRGRKRLGEPLAHADRLRALSWKYEGRLHPESFLFHSSRGARAETRAGSGCQGRAGGVSTGAKVRAAARM